MSDLIDRDSLKSAMCTACSNGTVESVGCNGDNCAIIDVINSQPKIDSESIHKGRWIYVKDGIRCSLCNVFVPLNSKYYKKKRDLILDNPRCKSCGAKMDLRTITEISLDCADDVMMRGIKND